MSEMNEILARYGIDYTFYNAVFAILLLLIGGIIGALIGGRHKTSAEMYFDEDEDDDPYYPQLPTKGGSRHGEKVTICGAEWTIM